MDEEYDEDEYTNLYVVQATGPVDEIESPCESSGVNDLSESIFYYKNRVAACNKKIHKMRQKIEYLRKVQLQFSMLLNKTVENHYGPLVIEQPVQKPSMPPLPPIHKKSHTELQAFLHQTTPNDVIKYVKSSSLIPRLVFSDTSIFDENMMNSLMRASPDIRVAFFNASFMELQNTGSFIDKLLPLFSSIVESPALTAQLTDPVSHYHEFCEFYNQTLNTLAEILNYEDCKIVFSTQDGHTLLYPTENHNIIIDMDDSLCGVMFAQPTMTVRNPQSHRKYETISENLIFEKKYENVYSISFNMAMKATAGIVILYSHSPFSESDESKIRIVIEYLSPILCLFRSLHLQIAPSHYALLSEAISSLRSADSIIPCFTDQLCKVASAGQCRLMLTEENETFPEIPVLPEENSLIRQSVLMKAPFSYKNPRMRHDFNKNIDDIPNLPRLTSMFVYPIKNTCFVIVLYNSTIAPEFTPIQKSLTGNFTLAFPSLLYQLAIKKQMSSLKEDQAKETKSMYSSIQQLPPVLSSIESDSFFEVINKSIPEGVKCYLFVFESDTEALRYPDGAYVEASDLLIGTTGIMMTKEFDLNIDVAGDETVKSVLSISPQEISPKSVCVFSTTDPDILTDENTRYLSRLAKIILFALPWFCTTTKLKNLKTQHQLLRDATKLSISSFSKLIGAPIECHYYDPPLQSDPDFDCPLIISVETPKGIEAVLTSTENREDVKSSLIVFAEWMTGILTEKIESKPNGELVDFFIEVKILDIFKCAKEKLQEWISSINSMIHQEKLSKLVFLKSLLSEPICETWFDEKFRLIIYLVFYMQGIEMVWSCKTDKQLVELAQNCKPLACPYISAIFGKDFGIADSLEYDEKAHLVNIIDDVVFSYTLTDESQILTHIRTISMRAFKMNEKTIGWNAKGFMLLANVQPFNEPQSTPQNLLELYGENGRKTEVFRAERIYLPLIAFYSQKHQKLLKMTAIVREAITETRKITR